MYNKEVEDKLKQLRIEDFIWVIYIGIIALSYYSNYLERRYYVFNDINSKNKYQKIMIFIFAILLIVYLYFLKSSYDDYKDLNSNDTYKKKQLVTLSLIASLLIAISGILFLYIACNNQELDVELAFN